ncbi:MAG: NAD-dependent dehydratase, partial [Deltaproteobacteria bacterium]|nr:NAD-dependent dehydratase [Deltaproteobacteria bacterium]
METLVIGGTGPTGPHIVEGLLERGHRVTILHTGRHEADAITDRVAHVHTDPYDPDALGQALASASYDLCIATYGRLRTIAELMRGRCGRFVSVGGGPSYRGYMNPTLLRPAGLPVPAYEDGPRVARPEEDQKGYRIARTEDAVFDHQPDATHFRYPIVYGPGQLMPSEWCIVRRVLDGRRRIILPDDGLTLCHRGFTLNLAHAVLLAVDRPDASSGRIYNCGDEEVLTLRQIVEAIAIAMDHAFEIVSMPWALATPARPLVMQPLPTHRVYDLGRLRMDLGYRDVVKPHDALALTARWLRDHPPEPGGVEEKVLQDPFDYAA